VEAKHGRDDPSPEVPAAEPAQPRRAASATVPRLEIPPTERIGVAHLTAEYWPFARTGGLGEAVSGLATCQAAMGLPTTVIMPLYQIVRETTPSLERTGSRSPSRSAGTPSALAVSHASRSRSAGVLHRASRLFRPGGHLRRQQRGLSGQRPQVRFFSLAALTALPEIAPETQAAARARLAHRVAPVYSARVRR